MDERREQLLSAADRAVRRAGPAASMDEIATEAGITKPILYKHFGDKGGLYAALAETYMRPLLDDLKAAWTTPDPYERLVEGVDTYLRFVESDPERYRFLSRAPAEPEAYAAVTAFQREVAEGLAEVLASDHELFGIDERAAEPWAYGICGMVQLAADWWLTNGLMSRAELLDYIVKLVWDGYARMPLRMPAPARTRR